jgi:hypothetical protein
MFICLDMRVDPDLVRGAGEVPAVSNFQLCLSAPAHFRI